jgi:hypothetical protein
VDGEIRELDEEIKDAAEPQDGRFDFDGVAWLLRERDCDE